MQHVTPGRGGVALAMLALAAGLSAPAAGSSASTTAATPAGATATAELALRGAAPPVHLPDHPQGLTPPGGIGRQIDPPASYQGQIACRTTAMRGVVRLRRLVLDTYGRGGTSSAAPRPCAVGGQSEHKEGRAWDWMVDVGDKADRRAAANFLGWLTGPGPSGTRAEMASRLGVMYVIYNRKSWSSYTGTWRDYTGYDPHTSHVHISLSWNGARAHTSFWTGRVWPTDVGSCQFLRSQPGAVPPRRPRTRACPAAAAAPRSSSRPFAWLGSSGAAVARAQRRLGVASNGRFGTATRRAVLDYQRGHDLPPTGALDDPTWASLLPGSADLDAPDWTARSAAAWARGTAGSPTLRRQDAGLAVFSLQVALRLPRDRQNGWFGPATVAAVTAFKRSVGLTADARVGGPEVWAALPADIDS